MAVDFICQKCGVEAPVRKVAFYRNIGMLVARRWYSYKGSLCKKCVHQQFWKFTGLTMVTGWWGYISVVMNTGFVLNNVVRYVGLLAMPGVPFGATAPKFDDVVLKQITPFGDEIVGRLNAGEDASTVLRNVASRAGVTPGQALRYVQWRSRPAPPPQRPTYGFPIEPNKPIPAQAIPPQLPPSPPPPATPAFQPVQSLQSAQSSPPNYAAPLPETTSQAPAVEDDLLLSLDPPPSRAGNS